MKHLILLFILLYFFLPYGNTASFPVIKNKPSVISDSLSLNKILNLSPKDIQRLSGQKMNLIEKLELKIIQKKIKKNLSKADEKKSKETVSLIALITGILGLILLFIFPPVSFILILTAIITGIIGVNNNSNQKSRTKALIGLICGLVGVGIFIIALVAFATGAFF